MAEVEREGHARGPARDTLILMLKMSRPTSVSVLVYRIEDDRQQSRPLPGSRPVRITGQGATLDVVLDPGEYLLNVYLNWGANSASYGFRVILSPQ
ncbi:MAG: hypothetical protein U0841_23245 [Chloroflexia bacterium]